MIDEKEILIFTASYNEAENIEKLIKGIKKCLPLSSILIVDDNSPDKTQQKIIKLKKEIKQINLIVREKKMGLDTAHKLAYEFAVKEKFNYLITMDADLSHDPNELINFIKNLEKNSFVIGSRYIRGGKCLMKGSRLLMSKLGNLVIKFFSNINCNEFTTSYRGFNINKLKGFHLNYVKESGYSFFMGTVFEINRRNFNIKEIPITFADREKGISKIPKLEIIRTLINLLIYILKK
tara:strand:+ start:30 stop:737 length:708 start_codon:yes stop_codon:yes gene_type:complete